MVSLLTVEYYTLNVSPDMMDDELLRVTEETLMVTCGVDSPGKPELEFFMYKLAKIEETEPATKPQGGQSLGTSFFDYIGKLDTVQILGMMTNYNKTLMDELYCRTDFLHVRDLMRGYVEMLREQQVVNFEAVMYGMGNSYKNDSSNGSTNVIDANTKEGMAMMSQFGVGDISMEQLAQLNLAPVIS